MNIKKLLIAGIVLTVFDAIVGGVCCGCIFSIVYKIEPTNVWRPMCAPGAFFFIGKLVLNVILAYVYVLLSKGIPGKNKIAKGAIFGLCVFAVGTLPGMFATHVFMTVATTVVVYWTVLALITSPIKGIIIASIYGE